MKHGMLLGLVAAGLLLTATIGWTADSTLTAPAVSAPTVADTLPAVATPPSLMDEALPSLLRIVGSLLVIVIAIYLAVFLLRRLSGNRAGGGRVKTIQVIEQTYLAPKKAVCLLKLADRAVLVGITDTSINLLTEFDWETLPPEVMKKISAPPAGFSTYLSDAAGKLFGSRAGKGVGRE